MGSGRFDPRDYHVFTASTASKSTDEIYSARGLHDLLNPKGVKLRESRDSDLNPKSTPLIVALDVTGSMGILADVIAREGLGTLFTTIYDRRPITDPHIMFMAVGDANCDRAPLQVSQFEADKRIIEQLTQIYLEHGGGGNRFESYNLPWYFAAFHTEHDSLIKRGKRGYLFTVGDEEVPGDLTNAQIEAFIGDTLEQPLTTKDMLQLAQRSYDVFHIIIEEGDYASRHAERVRGSWEKLLGQRVISLADHKKLAETIVSAIEVSETGNADEATLHWGGDTARIVHEAVKRLPKATTPRLLGP